MSDEIKALVDAQAAQIKAQADQVAEQGKQIKNLADTITAQTAALVYVVKRKDHKTNGSPTVAQMELVNSITEHLTAMERRLSDRIAALDTERRKR